MVSADSTALTERQVTVLELREQGRTQQEVADRLGTTDANVSAIERAAEQNIEKARRTLELARTIRSPIQFSVSPGTSFDDLVASVYDHGNEAGVKIAYCRPELYTHLYGALEGCTNQSELKTTIDVGITNEGEVRVYTEAL
ncbi:MULTISPECIES: Tfx family DNA-binding protein [Halorubrum]|uniref:RNA polymerase subunit sigma-70 n=1 Tax=Halorubrum persicum TaxID=1383844 RepID=A0A2G1WEH4_9EURY|nr:Tfx family DNA-binding protein [Halorubrum persicum]OYR80554.1 RNA polymerase subunit sigma-70 [Halorubrum sp. E3]PHQ37396.1 RNA polymerase subunit sigma-70 [Halorubrum persicum]